jgi:ABC-type dipeptide/oligopeptide/nickel transport system permease component
MDDQRTDRASGDSMTAKQLAVKDLVVTVIGSTLICGFFGSFVAGIIFGVLLGLLIAALRFVKG